MEKKRRGRPPKDKSGIPVIKKVPRKRGRPPKQKAHYELNEALQTDVPERVVHEHLTREGQKTTCCKCGIDMAMHIQPLLPEEKLAKVKCSVCEG